MKLAAIGPLDNSGAASEMADALRQLAFSSVYIDHPTCRIDLIPISSWYLPKYADPAVDMRKFIDLHRPDVLVSWGRPPHAEFVRIWNEKGVRWVHVAHWDLFDPGLDTWRQAVLISPNQACKKALQEHGFRSIHLPIPVDTDRFAFRPRMKAETFLTIYGSGGPHSRRSLSELFLAWWELDKTPSLVVKSRGIPLELDHCQAPERVRIDVGIRREPADLYAEGDVAIQVSRYEAVGMPILEAMSSGIPVITTKVGPMSELAPELAVEPEGTVQVRLNGKGLLTSIVSVRRLRERIQSIHGTDISGLSARARALVEEKFSWKALRGQWINSLK